MSGPKKRKGGIGDPALQSILLVDNGSLRPEATRQLRRIAAAFGRRIGRKVEPVSLLHSNQVPAKALGGRKAEILEDAVLRRLRRGAREFVIVPLFIGRSRALTEFIPDLIRRWRRHSAEMKMRVAAPLADRSDHRLARILERQVRARLTRSFLRGERARIAVVDHGSAVRAVTQARDRIAAELRKRLGPKVAAVKGCSMERVSGQRADAGLLLEELLSVPPWNAGPLVVAQLFLLPGRHAGPSGDVANISRRAEEKSRRLRIVRTGLLGDDPALVEILADRFRATR